MCDVIREVKSGAKNGHISWTNTIWTSKFRLSQWNLSPFRLTPLPTHFVISRKSPIETIVNGIFHRPYGKSLSTRYLDGARTNKAALGVMALKKQDISIGTTFKGFCENWIDPIVPTWFSPKWFPLKWFSPTRFSCTVHNYVAFFSSRSINELCRKTERGFFNAFNWPRWFHTVREHDFEHASGRYPQ